MKERVLLAKVLAGLDVGLLPLAHANQLSRRGPRTGQLLQVLLEEADRQNKLGVRVGRVAVEVEPERVNKVAGYLLNEFEVFNEWSFVELVPTNVMQPPKIALESFFKQREE